MKCLVLSSRKYNKKNGGGEGTVTNIVYKGMSGLEVSTIFGDDQYAAGCFFDFEFNPSGFLTCVSGGERAEVFDLLKEAF